MTMGIRQYHKLVRDRIPEIIENQGETAVIRCLSQQDYIVALRDKLKEETNEYLEAGDTEELADILEVLHAIAEADGIGFDQLEDMRLRKRKERGGFAQRVFLEQVVSGQIAGE